MESWRRNPAVFWIIGLPPTVWLLLFFLVPLTLVWVLSFAELRGVIDMEVTGTLDNYARALDTLYLQIFGKSFVFAGLTTLVSLVFGFPVALAIVFAVEFVDAIIVEFAMAFATSIVIDMCIDVMN